MTTAAISVIAEIPDFGFGPAAGFADLHASLAEVNIDWTLATTGNAARFLADVIADATIVDFSGFDTACWEQIDSFAPPGSQWLSMSNPRFSDWAGKRGHRVVLVDQLYWMWGPAELGAGCYCHVAPAYFKPVSVAAEGFTLTRPIIAPGLAARRRPAATRSGTVIAFGGMAVAGDPTAGDRYAAWLLNAIMPALIASRAGPLQIVGGSPNLEKICAPWASHRAVIVHGALGRDSYLDLLASSAHQILTPGLATIIEAAELGLSPLFQPGANKSMVLQLDDLVGVAAQLCAPWSWAPEAASRFRSMPQIDALTEIAVLLEASTAPGSPEGARLGERVAAYVAETSRQPLELSIDKSLAEPATVVAAALVGQARAEQ